MYAWKFSLDDKDWEGEESTISECLRQAKHINFYYAESQYPGIYISETEVDTGWECDDVIYSRPKYYEFPEPGWGEER